MLHRSWTGLFGLAACWMIFGPSSAAQETESADTALTLNRGIIEYLRGERDEERLGLAD